MSLREKIRSKKGDILNIYCTAGYPGIDDLPKIIRYLDRYGADIIEVGIPYSDPLADGPTIQQSNAAAIANGITMNRIFEQIGNVSVDVQLVLMGYFNSVYHYGIERFLQACRARGVGHLILPDLPMHVYVDRYRDLFLQNGVDLIFLITPETAEDRIRCIDGFGSAFIYAVTRSGTTGKTDATDSSLFLRRISEMQLKTPVLAGFGISSPDDVKAVCEHVHGAIIGSAFIRHLGRANDLEGSIRQFMQQFKPQYHDHPA